MSKIKRENRVLGTKESGKKLLEFIKKALEADKIEDISVIDLEGKADFAYFVVVATGRSSKHISSVAEKLADSLNEYGIESIGIEGQATGDWVLLDAYDVIVHLFRQEVRENYQLEKMWDFDKNK